MDEKELKKLVTTPYEDIQEQQYRAEQKMEDVLMVVLLFWMFILCWCIALHYYAYIGVMHSLTPAQ